MSTANILFLRGLRDDGKVKIVKVINNSELIYNSEGSCNVFDFVNNTTFNKQLITLDATQEQSINPVECNLIFNQIANTDTHKLSLFKANKICETFKNINCINHPLIISKLGRDQLANQLSGIKGFSIPKTIRFSPESALSIESKISDLNWRYPVIIRQCGDHNGRNMEKLDNKDSIKALAYTYFSNECYLTQFIDTKDDNGLYKKIRLVVVNGKFFIRHVLYTDNWKVSSDARAFMKKNSWLYDYEKTFIEKFDSETRPQITEAIKQIHQAIKLDYYGIDCTIDANMSLIIFELNANMNILYNSAPLPSLWAPCIDNINHAIVEMINNRLTSS